MNQLNSLPAELAAIKINDKSELTLKEAMTTNIDDAIGEMQAGLNVANGVVKILSQMIEQINADPALIANTNPMHLKKIIETNATAMGIIRKLRYMDTNEATFSDNSSIDNALKRIHERALESGEINLPVYTNETTEAPSVSRTTTTTRTKTVVNAGKRTIVAGGYQSDRASADKRLRDQPKKHITNRMRPGETFDNAKFSL